MNLVNSRHITDLRYVVSVYVYEYIGNQDLIRIFFLKNILQIFPIKSVNKRMRTEEVHPLSRS